MDYVRCGGPLKVKEQVHSLISSLKNYYQTLNFTPRFRILVQVKLYRRLRIGPDGHLDQSEAYDISDLDLFIRVPFQLHGEHTVF